MEAQGVISKLQNLTNYYHAIIQHHPAQRLILSPVAPQHILHDISGQYTLLQMQLRGIKMLLQWYASPDPLTVRRWVIAQCGVILRTCLILSRAGAQRFGVVKLLTYTKY